MNFKPYQRLKRFNTPEVEGIEIGKTYIFHKLDGTNATVYLDSNGDIKAGSRTRELTLDNDNAGFYAYVLKNENLKKYLEKNPTHRLFGEFLVPHTLRTYKDDAWEKFYIFDVCVDKEGNQVEYLPYDMYKPLLEEFKLNYVPPIAIVQNGDYEQFINLLSKNDFLIQDGKGVGEGIVIKNYEYRNKFGRQTWAKIINSEFKERFVKTMGPPVIKNKNIIEQKIVDEFCTEAFIEKEYAKLVNRKQGFSNENIPELIGRTWYEFITEESFNIIKKFKNPTINYRLLNRLVIQKIKEVKKDIFKGVD